MDAQPAIGRRAPGAHRSRVGLAAMAAAVLLTSACAAGQLAQTSDEKNSIDGTNASVGNIQLRAVAFKAPIGSPFYIAGSDAELTAVIVNDGQTNDTLTSISSPSATGGWGSYSSQQDGYTVQAADSDAATAAAAGTPTPTETSASPATSGAASGTTSPSASASLPAAAASVVIPAGNRVSWAVPDSSKVLLLRKLRDSAYPGSTIQVRFTFARAGSVTMQVPIQLTGSPGSAEVPEPAGSEAN